MRWYFNDASLQGQFATSDQEPRSSPALSNFEEFLRSLLAIRSVIHPLHVTRSLPNRLVSPGTTVRTALQQTRNLDLKRVVLTWLDRNGPFIEDDRFPEQDDLFLFFNLDVTDSGLGEAARRKNSGENAWTFSVPGGAISFAHSPLVVEHGLPGESLGEVSVGNVWSIEALKTAAANEQVVTSWQSLVAVARQRYTRLLIPDAVFQHKMLAREPFSEVIARQSLTLLGHLDAYMGGRGSNGEDGPVSRDVIDRFFVGARAAFTGESPSNQEDFRKELTFPDPCGAGEIFAHWHGKISHRVFRLHFEFPVPKAAKKLRIFYLGPKITKH